MNFIYQKQNNSTSVISQRRMYKAHTMKISIIVMLCVVVSACAQESRTVQTAQGPVRGYLSEDGELFQFLGIPYATAPTGERKFQAPMPGPIWTEPFEAVEDSIICPQSPSPQTEGTNMQENCLIANIYSPNTNETNLPVLVYVHGGGYVTGYGTMQSPVSLVRSQKLMAVTFNYRLGAHGFLCLGTEGAPGNAGMKDQVALLRWVQKNIANFGGNPEEVTIGGGSAGSSSVDLLMLSDMTKGLYNKVISESGASVSAWSIQVDPVKYAQDYATQIMGFNNTEDLYALEEYYKSASFDKILVSDFMKIDSSLYFGPCLERDLGEEIFLKDAPVDILTQGNYRKVPVLYGFANMEGIFFIPYFNERVHNMNERFADFLPADLQFSSEEERTEVAATIEKFYFGDRPVSEDTAQAYIDYYSDMMFAYGHLRSLKLQVEAGSESIYLYEYSFFSPYADGLYPDFMDNIHGAIHRAQSLAIYDSDFRHLDINDDSEEYKKIQEILREMWINFITSGKPVPEGSHLPAWPPVGADRSPYMDLGEEIQLKGRLLEQRARLWDGIYERYYRTPVPPSAPSNAAAISSYSAIL